MAAADNDSRRVRFYGASDLAAGWHIPRVVELAAEFNPELAPGTVVDILELHNVQQYLEHRLLPSSLTEKERDRLLAQLPQIRSSVARFFSAIDNSNFAATVTGVQGHYEYRADLVDLLGRYRAFDRTDSAIAIPALQAAGVHLGEMLASKLLVQRYDAQIRDELLASPRNAEYLVRKYLEKRSGGAVHLPPSFRPLDARYLLERYLDDEDANLNYVRLIVTANDTADAGIDAKLKLRAKRRSEELNAKLFEQNAGLKTGCEVSISDVQDEPVVFDVDSSDGSVWRYTYSRRWLEASLDYPSVLNNFQHLFEFVDDQVLSTLPAYPAHLSVMERVMGLSGRSDYKVGVVFRNIDARSRIQVQMYRQFLESQGVDLEKVISWFFETYLTEEFEMPNFSFVPSDSGASYLPRVRHLFAEMESVANQFSLFVTNGELDRDLLTMGSNQVRYGAVPSLLKGKYLYSSGGEDVSAVLHLLFSDQSSLNYVNDELQDVNTAGLLLRNHVAYADFREDQKSTVDYLAGLGVLDTTGNRVRFAKVEQLLLLASLSNTLGANYYHLSDAGRAEANSLVERGWAVCRSSLMTDAEADYFNYFLNRVTFSNGPNLRNTYLHGSQPRASSDEEHFTTYIVAMRLIVALVIKMNDELCLRQQTETQAGQTEL